MQFKKETLAQIAAKRVNLAFRRWKRPSLKAGDAISTAIGELSVLSCARIAIAKISAADLKRAGYTSRSALLREIANHPGDVYKIAFRLKPAEVPPEKVAPKPPAPKAAKNPAPKTAPLPAPEAPPPMVARMPTPAPPRPRMLAFTLASRSEPQAPEPPKGEEKITKAELKSAIAALKTLDQSSGHGAWTATTLRLIDKYPARRAPDLAASQRRDPLLFKRDVLRLKQLGLTENLEIGYRLSPRGRAILAEINGG
jgi:hypothetical protein